MVYLKTVKDDPHDIAINLMAMMMKGAGFKVTDIGKGVDHVTNK
jgi:methanogenic corrinoid protein MtbC1